MPKRLTERAGRVIIQAQQQAKKLGHDSVDARHILLGLVHEHDGVAAGSCGG